MIYPEWNVNGICQEPGVERTTQVTSLAQLLKNNGYHTIHCGKAHFGEMCIRYRVLGVDTHTF